ncbi:MAG: DUF4129 domain-containing protein [Desulfitobacteriia bacterium]|jgi:hypothetical protein
MGFRDLIQDLALIFSESCFFALLYLCLTDLLLSENLLVSPIVFFILTAAIIITNFFLSFKSWRLITIVLLNILVAGIVVFLIIHQSTLSGSYLLQSPTGVMPALNIIFVYGTIIWLIIRSLLIFYRRNTNVYSHFDLYVSLTLIILLIAGLASTTLPGETGWAIAALLLNLFSLYIYNNRESKSTLWEWILGGFVAVSLYLASRTVIVSSSVSTQAETVLNFIKNIGTALLHMLAGTILFLRKLLLGRGVRSPVAEDHTAGQYKIVDQASISLSWLDILFTGVLWFTAAILLCVVVVSCLTMLRYLLFQLKKRRKVNVRVAFDPFLPWKRILEFSRRLLKRICFYLLPFSPARISIPQAYRLILEWGSSKKYPRRGEETPYAYCRRLSAKFPQISAELKEITDSFVLYRYTENSSQTKYKKDLKQKVRRVYLGDYYRLIKVFKKR